MNNIALVFTVNNEYIDALEVFLKSYLEHNAICPDIKIIQEEDITQENKIKILNLYNNVEFIRPSISNNFESTERRLWKINPLNRYSLFDIRGYNKLLFLDADMVVLRSIEDLYNLNVDFGAVYHPYPDGKDSKLITEGSIFFNNKFDHSKSFNGGIMLIDKKFINDNLKNELISISTSYKWLGNQGPLNVRFNNVVSLLDTSYFVTTPHLTAENLQTAKMLHFGGVKKPWFNKSIDLRENFDDHVLSSVPRRTLLLNALLKYKRYLN